MRFLLFTLYAPLAAFGEIAPSERRLGWTRPSRSAVLGLVAAGLGIERDAEEVHAALDSGLGYAVKTEAAGRPLLDYHTAQMPPTRRGRRFSTRREELAVDDLNTVLSTREWRTDALYTAALWRRAEGEPSLAAIGAALIRPRFVLYLGRKAAPFGLPLAPEVVEAGDLAAAFAGRRQLGPEEDVRTALGVRGRAEIALDAGDSALVGVDAGKGTIVRRRDAPTSRVRRQFRERDELLVAVVPQVSA